jgi:hypothetical protein
MEVSLSILLAFMIGGFFLILNSISDLLGKQKYSPYYRLALGIVIFLGTIYSICMLLLK